MDETGERKAHILSYLLGFDFSTSPHLHGLLNHPRQLSQLGLGYLQDFFQATSEIEPMLVFLEDIHWADDRSLQVIDRLGSRTPEHRIQIVCVARNRLFERRPNWGSGWSAHTHLALEPLSSDRVDLW